MGCKPKCLETSAITGPGGKRIMVSQGNAKFKKGEPHPRCDDCAAEQAEFAKLMLIYDNNIEAVETYLKLKKEVKKRAK